MKYFFCLVLLGLRFFSALRDADSTLRFCMTHRAGTTAIAEAPTPEPPSFIDSIQREVSGMSSLLGQVDSLYRWALGYQAKDSSKAVALARLGQQRSRRMANPEWETTFNFVMGRNYMHLAEYDSADRIYDKIIVGAQSAGNQADQALIMLQKEELSPKNLLQILSLGFAALLVGILLLLYRSYRVKRGSNHLLTLADRQLEGKNQENALLLKGIHHRVKNNLQTASSLLSLQSESVRDKSAFDAVQESQNRVNSMALLHQKLYQGENLVAIEMRDYFETIGKAVIDNFGEKAAKVSLKVEMPQIELDVDTAIPIGLITNELITNSMKHAFSGRQQGAIQVTLVQQPGGLLKLHLTDDGQPRSSEKPSSKEPGFGTLLIKLLTTQLGGKMEKSTQAGTSTVITFPRQEKSAA